MTQYIQSPTTVSYLTRNQHLCIHLLLQNAPNFSAFRPASEFEISKILFTCPSEQYDSDAIPTWLLKECALLITISSTVNLSLNVAQVTSITLLKNLTQLPFSVLTISSHCSIYHIVILIFVFLPSSDAT